MTFPPERPSAAGLQRLERQLEVSEVFESLQGEGPSAGTPALFLRLAGCNLACSFCDTRYSWDFSRRAREREVELVDVARAREQLEASALRRLVVTGGEPLLQQLALGVLIEGLDDWVIEVETNGTLAPRSALAERVDQWNVSPKLSNSGMRDARRVRPDALAAFGATGRAWLKLVVDGDDDVAEAERLVTDLDWPRDRVCLMPQAADPHTLRARAPGVAAACLRLGFRYSPRLHVELWAGARGR